MTDLEITKLCAEAVGGEPRQYGETVYAMDKDGVRHFDPLHDDAQAMALVKKFGLWIQGPHGEDKGWDVSMLKLGASHLDLNRAICECVAKMKKAEK